MGRGGGGGEEEELRAAKRGYKAAESVGNHEEEARWANVVGDIYKRRGEYVEALRWLRIDYEVSVKYLPQKQLLPTCQSLGEVYLRLDRFSEALTYQKKHLELAKDSDDLIEQQRASTQLGRTYHEMFLRSENDHTAIRNAKKYFKSAMKLARILKENPLSKTSSHFLKEFIDAHNNIGMLEMDLDNLEEAEKILLQGLKICDDEEVSHNDDGRSRLHHNLGSLYIEVREWSKARDHIERDILICRKICHLQGEAKGFINLGELHYRVQKYDDALRCYQKALDTAKPLEDEDALIDQIKQNINTVKEAAKVLEELKKDEQKLKKLIRITNEARGTSNERKCLLEQNACLDGLIEKAGMIFAWPKHQEFAKRKKKVANELCDKEKLSDSFLAIGESYQKLRNFSKARKWYMKSWNIYRSIGNVEGQAMVKINVGEVLDSSGDWASALEAFEEGYRMAVQGNLPSLQISALDNMHYSHMIRFDNFEEARKVQHEIEKLKCSLKEDALCNLENEYCAETETEGGNVSDSFPDQCISPDNNIATSKPRLLTIVDDFDEDIPLATLVRQSKSSSKIKSPQINFHGTKVSMPSYSGEASSRDLSKSNDEQHLVRRKRVRVVLSDDEDNETDDIEISKWPHKSSTYGMTTSSRDNGMVKPRHMDEAQDVLCLNPSKDVASASMPLHIEESTCSFKCKNHTDFGSSNDVEAAVTSKSAASESRSDNGPNPYSFLPSQNGAGSDLPLDNCHILKLKVSDKIMHMDVNSCMDAGNLNVESMKVEVACRYYLQLPEEKRSRGLLPVIGQFLCCGKALHPLEPIENVMRLVSENMWIDVVIDGWVPKRLMKLYVDCCKNLSEPTNLKLLQKLYNLEVSEDEVMASDCGLQDVSVSPFLDAIEAHKMVAVLDVSHNLLGNETMEKLQKIFSSSSQKYGGLTLDLHSNRFGPTALFQICESPIISARLEVLNLSENRLTDACSSYLSTILENCKALYSLNIEHCHITSRTIQKIADALHDGSVLTHLSIGKNSPISGNAMVNLLSKLGFLKRFSELSLTGIRLNKIMVASLCQLAHSSCLSSLMLGETYIGIDGAISLGEALLSGPQELARLDISYCGLASHDLSKVSINFAALGGILELNLEGNIISQEDCDALELLLMDPKCTLKSLTLNKCHLGLAGMIRILHALADNDSLEELHLAENVDVAQERALQHVPRIQGSATPIAQKSDVVEMANRSCEWNVKSHELQVADSDDETGKEEHPTLSNFTGSYASSCQRKQNAGFQLIQELSEAIASASQLKLLNLSHNRYTEEAVEALYSAWLISKSRCNGMARKHVSKDLVHFLADGKRCCVRPCCRRDSMNFLV